MIALKEKILKIIPSLLKIGMSVSLIILLLGIFRINFSLNSDYYNSDMYSDILYSKYVWQEHNIFPDNWVFGNQIYVIATPVLASLFFCFTDNPLIVMGIASSIMAIGVMLSFLWMLKPAIKDIWSRLFGLFALLTLTLLSGDPIFSTNGWQLLFTMCSYYACYAIVAFIGFGIYLRADNKINKSKKAFIAALISECILSFCTGMQSLRQTAIMSLPLLGAEFILIVEKIIKKEKLFNEKTAVAIAISASNLFGVIAIKSANIRMHQIIGKLQFNSAKDVLSKLISEYSNIISLFGDNISKLPSIIIGILLLGSVILILIKQKSKIKKEITLLLLLSVGAIYIISTFTSISSRNIYYFMMFPLVSLLIAFSYEFSKDHVRTIFMIILIPVSLLCLLYKTPLKQPSHYINYEYKEISALLISKDIKTLYSPFSFGGRISLDSDLKIQTGFWFGENNFKKVDYICNPEIFNIYPKNSAYVFTDNSMKNEALKIADSNNAKTELIYYSSENNIWIYSSSQRLIN